MRHVTEFITLQSRQPDSWQTRFNHFLRSHLAIIPHDDVANALVRGALGARARRQAGQRVGLAVPRRIVRRAARQPRRFSLFMFDFPVCSPSAQAGGHK